MGALLAEPLSQYESADCDVEQKGCMLRNDYDVEQRGCMVAGDQRALPSDHHAGLRLRGGGVEGNEGAILGRSTPIDEINVLERYANGNSDDVTSEHDAQEGEQGGQRCYHQGRERQLAGSEGILEEKHRKDAGGLVPQEECRLGTDGNTVVGESHMRFNEGQTVSTQVREKVDECEQASEQKATSGDVRREGADDGRRESTSGDVSVASGLAGGDVDQEKVKERKIFVWDLDETLIVFQSLLTGKFASKRAGEKDEDFGRDLGETWERLILDLCDEHMFFRQIEDCDQPSVQHLSAYDDGADLSAYDFKGDGLKAPADDPLKKRQLAYRYRYLTSMYAEGVENFLTEMELNEWRELYQTTDHYTDGWLTAGRNLLQGCHLAGSYPALNNSPPKNQSPPRGKKRAVSAPTDAELDQKKMRSGDENQKLGIQTRAQPQTQAQFLNAANTKRNHNLHSNPHPNLNPCPSGASEIPPLVQQSIDKIAYPNTNSNLNPGSRLALNSQPGNVAADQLEKSRTGLEGDPEGGKCFVGGPEKETSVNKRLAAGWFVRDEGKETGAVRRLAAHGFLGDQEKETGVNRRLAAGGFGVDLANGVNKGTEGCDRDVSKMEVGGNGGAANLNVIVTSGQLVPTLAKLMLFRLNGLIDPINVYSSRDVGKLQCFEWIRERFAPPPGHPPVRFCAVGDGLDELEAAQDLGWPFLEVAHAVKEQRLPNLPLATFLAL